jgi:hypothetical protein
MTAAQRLKAKLQAKLEAAAERDKAEAARKRALTELPSYPHR